MFRLSISVAAFAAAIASNSGHAEIPASPEEDDAPQHTILMFGASWCAPCITELRNIATLASSASPDRIVIAWTDTGIRHYRLAPPDNVEIVSSSDAQRMARQYASNASGLPYSAMLNGHGHKCAELNVPLTPEAIRRMRLTCAAVPE